jgi:hypothetical protein
VPKYLKWFRTFRFMSGVLCFISHFCVRLTCFAHLILLEVCEAKTESYYLYSRSLISVPLAFSATVDLLFSSSLNVAGVNCIRTGFRGNHLWNGDTHRIVSQHEISWPSVLLSPLKPGFLLNNIYKSSSYLTGNTLRLHYKAQPVNAVWGISLFIVRTIWNT